MFILGHDEPLEQLRQSAARGRLGHTYAFIGPAGIGKRTFAIALAQRLLCERHPESELLACGQCPGCVQVAAGTHPDLHVVGLLPGKSALSIDQFVGEDERRGREGLCHDLSLQPMAGRRKVAIIDDAESFSPEAANSLLKTLEEPPSHSLIILIAVSKDSLLPTIRSRCQIVTFRPLAEENLRELLLRREMTADAGEAAEIAQLADGSLETARQLLDPHLREQRRVLYDMLARVPFASVQLAAAMIEGLDSSGPEKSSQRASAGWVVRFAIEFFRTALLSLAEGPSRAATIPQVALFVSRLPDEPDEALDRIGDLLQRCVAADRQLEGNATIPLCLETLFDDLGRRMRV